MPTLRNDIEETYEFLNSGNTGISSVDVNDTYNFLYGKDQAPVETPKSTMSPEQAQRIRELDYLDKFIPLPTKTVAAYIASKLTGEDYDTVKQKMNARTAEARKITAQEFPSYDTALRTLEEVGEPSSQMALATGVGKGIAAGGKYLASIPAIANPAIKAGKVLSKVPGLSAYGRALISTNPVARSLGWGSTVGGITTAASLAKGDTVGQALQKGAMTAGDVAAYTLGTSYLPKKVTLPLAMGYEMIKGAAGRAMDTKKVFSLPDIARDATTGFLKKSAYSGAKLNEYGEPVAGGKEAKVASSYMTGNKQKPFRHVAEAKENYKPAMGHKYLKDVPTQTNVENLKRFKITVPEEVKESAAYYENKAREVGNRLNESIKAEAKGKLTEDLLQQQEKLTAKVNELTEKLKENKVPVSAVKKVFGKDTTKILKQYAKFREQDTGTFSVPRMKDNLEPEYLLGTRQQASKQSIQQFKPFSRDTREKMYNVFPDQASAQELKKVNKVLSDNYENLEKLNTAKEVTNYMSDPEVVAKEFGDPASRRGLYSNIMQRVNNGLNTGSKGQLHTHTTDLLSKESQELLKEYDYLRTMADIAKSPAGGATGSMAPALDMQGRVVASPLLDTRFSAYMTAKEVAKELSKKATRGLEKATYRFMNNTRVPRAIQAMDPKKGNVFVNSIKPDLVKGAPAFIINDIINKMPKRKEEKKK